MFLHALTACDHMDVTSLVLIVLYVLVIVLSV